MDAAAKAAKKEQQERFKKGARVEVSLEDEGFRGSWYSATVLRPLSYKTHKIYLEFDTLVDDANSNKPLREHVDVLLVRPIPPRETTRTFQLSEEVDAFHNDGWWEGVVTQVSPPPANNSNATGGAATPPSPRYSIFFRSSREQLDFTASDLRLHREWVRGNWVPPLEAADDAPAASHDKTN